MRSVLFLIFCFLLAFPVFALDIDVDDNNATDITFGGTNASNASEARSNLSVYSKSETNSTFLEESNNLSDVLNSTTAFENLIQNSLTNATIPYWDDNNSKMVDSPITTNGTNVDINGTLTFDDKYHYLTIFAQADTAQGNTSPTATTIGTYRFSVFDADAETVFIEVEIPDEWTADSNMTLEIYFTGQVGTPMADTETFISQIEYRCMAHGDVLDGGTAVSTNSTYTQSGNATDKQLYQHSITLDYNNTDQPLTASENLGIKYNRDMTNDSYGSDINILKWEIEFEANAPLSHF